VSRACLVKDRLTKDVRQIAVYCKHSAINEFLTSCRPNICNINTYTTEMTVTIQVHVSSDSYHTLFVMKKLD